MADTLAGFEDSLFRQIQDKVALALYEEKDPLEGSIMFAEPEDESGRVESMTDWALGWTDMGDAMAIGEGIKERDPGLAALGAGSLMLGPLLSVNALKSVDDAVALDLSREARMARAADQGFLTNERVQELIQEKIEDEHMPKLTGYTGAPIGEGQLKADLEGLIKGNTLIDPDFGEVDTQSVYESIMANTSSPQLADLMSNYSDNAFSASDLMKDQDQMYELLDHAVESNADWIKGRTLADLEERDAWQNLTEAGAGDDFWDVFHGTSAGDVEGFETEMLGTATSADSAKRGVFAANLTEDANRYADKSTHPRTQLKGTEYDEIWQKLNDAQFEAEGAGRSLTHHQKKAEIEFMADPKAWVEREFGSESMREPILKELEGAMEKVRREKPGVKRNDIVAAENLTSDPTSNFHYYKNFSKSSLPLRNEQITRRETLEALRSRLEELKGSPEYQARPNVIPMHVRANNPMVVDKGGSGYGDITMHLDLAKHGEVDIDAIPAEELSRMREEHMKLVVPDILGADPSAPNFREFVRENYPQYIKGGGHDSVIFFDIADPTSGATHVVAFEPSQLRSRFAKFDPKDINSADLLASLTGAALMKESLMTDKDYE